MFNFDAKFRIICQSYTFDAAERIVFRDGSEGTDRIAVEKLHFRIGGFLLYIRARCPPIQFPKFSKLKRVAAPMHTFYSLQRFESINRILLLRFDIESALFLLFIY